mmetsp:Transcript_25334/g.51830  ORF Transcript_25334/g.51830 Transcript_25334/m.51830 type:complete len:298 (-) Transcript_25334:223-1116(-)
MTNHERNNNNNSNNKNTSQGPATRRRSSRGPVHSAFRNSYSIFEAIRSDSERINPIDTRRSNDAARGHLDDIKDEDDTVDLSSVTTKGESDPPGFEIVNLHHSYRELSKSPFVEFPEDLKNLWVSDPFLYYSIPEIHKNAYKVDSDEDDDDAELEREYGVAPSGMPRLSMTTPPPSRAQNPAAEQQQQQQMNNEQTNEESRPTRRRSSNTLRNLSCPAGMLANADISYALFHGGTTLVTRRHRISTEAHPSLIVDDFVGDEESSDDEDFDIEDDDFEEPLLGVLKKMSSKRMLGHND